MKTMTCKYLQCNHYLSRISKIVLLTFYHSASCGGGVTLGLSIEGVPNLFGVSYWLHFPL